MFIAFQKKNFFDVNYCTKIHNFQYSETMRTKIILVY